MLALAVDIRRWLQNDRARPFSERLQRDRDIGMRLESLPERERVLSWWARMDHGPAPSLGERVVALRALSVTLLFALGLLLGIGVAGVAFAYDGQHPVNLLPLLGVLVGLPLVMLLFTLALLPVYLPGLGGLQAILAGMSPGRWLGAWLDRYVGAEVFAFALHSRSQTNTFAKWQLVVFSQWLAVGFFVGVLLLASLLIAFTDLAFGWSTTLDIQASQIHAWLDALAWPWATWLPDASPSLALVETSRFFRLEDSDLPRAAVAVLGTWWPFVLITVIAYGFLPRLLLLLLAQWRLTAATRALLINNPDVTALLDRLASPLVETGALTETKAAEESAEESPPPPAGQHENVGLVIWNGAASVANAKQWLGANLGVSAESVVEISILQAPSDIQSALSALRRAPQRLVLFTKGWEPPLLEFSDFLADLRSAVGHERSVAVVPIDVSGGRVNASHRQVWARALAKLEDARLYVTEAMA